MAAWSGHAKDVLHSAEHPANRAFTSTETRSVQPYWWLAGWPVCCRWRRVFSDLPGVSSDVAVMTEHGNRSTENVSQTKPSQAKPSQKSVNSQSKQWPSQDTAMQRNDTGQAIPCKRAVVDCALSEWWVCPVHGTGWLVRLLSAGDVTPCPGKSTNTLQRRRPRANRNKQQISAVTGRCRSS